MKFDELFEHRRLVASKLKDCIRDAGYTKVAFANKADVSRPTLAKILNGSIDSTTPFDRHLQKILAVLNLTADDLVFYSTDHQQFVAAVYSNNAPENHEMSDKAKKQVELLLDVIDLCTIYY